MAMRLSGRQHGKSFPIEQPSLLYVAYDKTQSVHSAKT